MSEVVLIVAGGLSLVMTFIYGFVKKNLAMKVELDSAKRIGLIAGLRTSSSSSVEEVLVKILQALAAAYDASSAHIEFQGKYFGDHSFRTERPDRTGNPRSGRISAALQRIDVMMGVSRPKMAGQKLTFMFDDKHFSCRTEVFTDLVPYHDEYANMHEVLREKLAHHIYSKLGKFGTILMESTEIPLAVTGSQGKILFRNPSFASVFHNLDEPGIAGIVAGTPNADGAIEQVLGSELAIPLTVSKVDESLNLLAAPKVKIPGSYGRQEDVPELFLAALDDLSVGMVLLEMRGKLKEPEYKIAKINRAFFRIFGLEGSQAQADEVEEILSVAVRPNEIKNFAESTTRLGGTFSYQRHDGLKVRAEVSVVKDARGSALVLFEPLENYRYLTSSYKVLLKATQRLFASGDKRAYLREVMSATRSDGVALVRKTPHLGGFEITDKVGFIINVPQLLIEDLPMREFANVQGYLVVPMKEKEEVTGAIIALKPDPDAIEVVFIGAKLFEAYCYLQGESHHLRFENAKLLADARRADAATKSKSEFLANMSHEIRTPLNSVIGFADIINTEAGELTRDLLAEFSGNIVTAGRHLLSLINDILDLAKIETGKMKLDLQEFSLTDVVESVGRILKPLLDKKQVRLTITIEEGIDVLTSDTVKFKQILYNLLNNAITYSHAKGVVTLDISKSADGIEMRVTDRGVGIKKEDLEKLFKPFVQVGGKNGGTGLGLTITRKFVELHGGAIWIDSTFGSGTTVSVYLPGSPVGTSREDNVQLELKDAICVITEDDELYSLFAAVMEGTGFNLRKIVPRHLETAAVQRDSDPVLVVDATPDNLSQEVLAACGEAERVLFLVDPGEVRNITELMKDCESKISFIDRRNFTKSDLLAELNVAGRSR